MIGLVSIVSCNSKSEPSGPYDFFKKLEGTWKNNNSNQFEKWYYNKGVPRANSFKVTSQKDTVVLERIKILKQKDQLYFVAIVFNQKNEAPVRFKKTIETEESITFENKEHDFPQKIIYRVITPDSINASISGLIDGKEKIIVFPYTRIK